MGMWTGRCIDLLYTMKNRKLTDDGVIQGRKYYYQNAKEIHESLILNETKPYFLKRMLNSYYDKKSGKYKVYRVKNALKDEIDFITIE